MIFPRENFGNITIISYINQIFCRKKSPSGNKFSPVFEDIQIFQQTVGVCSSAAEICIAVEPDNSHSVAVCDKLNNIGVSVLSVNGYSQIRLLVRFLQIQLLCGSTQHELIEGLEPVKLHVLAVQLYNEIIIAAACHSETVGAVVILYFHGRNVEDIV